MDLELISLRPDSRDRRYFEAVNEEAFPPSERMSFDSAFELALKADADVLGIYDGKKPVGFVILLKNSECAYLYYLAIDQTVRTKGYGGAALHKLAEDYSDLQLILDFEEIDEAAPNYAQRIRRKRFYLRNGFCETGCYTKLSENRFEVVCNGGALRKDAFRELIHLLHAHRSEFPDELFEA